MLEKHAYPVLDEQTIDAFLDGHEEVVLFFSENPKQFPESDDLAVILPELLEALGGRLQAALISQGSQHRLQGRYGFGSWPALVFLRRGELLGVITQLRNWEDYLREIRQLLDADPVKSPRIKIPVVSEAPRGCQ
jgi:hydrogenase-1 operon protein HyaE